MHCPNCDHPDSRVTDSRDTGGEIRRRRECSRCGTRFTTYEHIQQEVLLVEKRDGRREEFQPEKLLNSIRIACNKRPIPSGMLDKLAQEVESDIRRIGRAEVKAARIGEFTIGRLRTLDPVAYLRYVSVYREFIDLDRFIREIEGFEPSADDKEGGDGTPQLALPFDDLEGPPKQRLRRGRRPRVTTPQR